MLKKLSAFDDRIVFSHNDLLANNILILDSDKSVSFIDFEYCHYNLRTYDISNYFNESKYDYCNPETPFYYVDNKEILREEYEDFIRVYLVCSDL